ncbi:MAG: M48 family metallopeptidase [Rhodocyclaceae bacterium]|nr:M48 family metallopeptidase [Rhodocyclaceae bacterium]
MESRGDASIEGLLFDGSSSRARPVRLAVVAGGFDLSFLDGSHGRERLPLHAIRWQEALGHQVRRATLADGSSLELPCGPALDRILAASRHREASVSRWQASASIALGALLVLLAVLFATYRWGLPAVAEHLAARVPADALAGFDGHLVGTLEAGGMIAPTTLPADQRAAIVAASRALPGPLPDLRFHAAPGIGANAFALPGGTIVVTDELVELAGSPRAVAAVVAHEMGHVHHRHGLRQLIQSSAIAVVVGLWIGDFDSMLTVASTVLLGSAYSREFEYEADGHGAALLTGAGLSPRLLADMLARLSADAGESQGAGGYLSSHPPTPERIDRLHRLSPNDQE